MLNIPNTLIMTLGAVERVGRNTFMLNVVAVVIDGGSLYEYR